MFTWDVLKAFANHQKHAVSFEQAVTVFADDRAIEVPDYKHSASEERFVRIGESENGRILTVVFTIRRLGCAKSSSYKETIRIISARQASRKERQAFARFQA